MADAVATTAGAVMGTSTTTTFVESASGVTEGGRTGLTSMTTAILFLLSLLLSPVFLAIPSFATAPALIIVGFYMVNQVGLIDFTDMQKASRHSSVSQQCRSSTAFLRVSPLV